MPTGNLLGPIITRSISPGRFNPISPLSVPRQWLLQSDQKKLEAAVMDGMKATMIEAYYEQLFPSRIGVVEDPAVEKIFTRPLEGTSRQRAATESLSKPAIHRVSACSKPQRFAAIANGLDRASMANARPLTYKRVNRRRAC
jgi:hypothetical protein